MTLTTPTINKHEIAILVWQMLAKNLPEMSPPPPYKLRVGFLSRLLYPCRVKIALTQPWQFYSQA